MRKTAYIGTIYINENNKKKIHTHKHTLHGVLSCYYYYYGGGGGGGGGPTHQCLWFIVHSCDVSMCKYTHLNIYVCVCV